MIFFQNFIAIFKLLEKDLLKCNPEDALSCLKDGTSALDQGMVLKHTINSKLNPEDFFKVLEIEKKKEII